MKNDKNEFRNEKEFILKDETYELIGCAFNVLNEHGHGYHEKIYENSLCVEFGFKGISYVQQRQYDVHYRKVWVGHFIPDLIAYEKIVIDAKTIEAITDREV